MARVLMIEDNLNDQKMASLFLTSSFEIMFADTFQHAVDMTNLCLPDVFLLDLNLPDSKGMETLSSLVKQFPQIPVVVWSGAGEASEAIRLGADEFILKNGNIEIVKEALTSAMARHPFKSVREDIASLKKLIATDLLTDTQGAPNV